ncbi:NAD-dependent methanol dehydrogenase [bacterium HR40]|nr:NAD-dependent methanol dehydrogenase [bacterium HR40]
MPGRDLETLVTSWSYPTRILFGPGTIGRVAEACREAGIARPLVVTDPELAKLMPVARCLEALASGGLAPALFTGVRPNPTEENVREGVQVLRTGDHDGIVAIGGGSALDVGKLVAFMAAQKRPIWDFEDIGDNWKRAETAGIRPVVAIPTTAGTGSEVGRAGVVTDPASHRKRVIFHPLMMPKTAILDPQLTLGLPPRLTAWTGMDALSHCIEAYCAPAFHPLSDGVAVEGVRQIHKALVVAFEDGSDIAARGRMLAASAMGAVAFQKGLGAVHALSHPIGAIYDTHHGLTNAVLLPYVLAHNYEAIETRITRLAAFLGLPQPSFGAFLDWILELRQRLGIPHTLQELGIPRDRFDELARMAVEDPTAAGNPTPLTVEVARQLLEDAFTGEGV